MLWMRQANCIHENIHEKLRHIKEGEREIEIERMWNEQEERNGKMAKLKRM